MFAEVFKGTRVLVTGDTGFKGSWLCTWLLELGAQVSGFANERPSEPCNFDVLGLGRRIEHFDGDIRNRESLTAAFDACDPEIVFHLAAQPLVRRSYENPTETFETNVMGTMNVLECIRQRPSVRVGVVITSDKCYRNVEWIWGYRENDELGGDDPYSASKGCAELIARSYMESFFQDEWPKLATTRAGNVVGGGDWAIDRIVPDIMRAWTSQSPLTIRSPNATRPWQHVLEPLSGYMWLAASMWRGDSDARNKAYNFGPPTAVNQSVQDLLEEMSGYWDYSEWATEGQAQSGKAEASLLKLNCDRAEQELGWHAALSFAETVRTIMAIHDRGQK